MSTSVEPTFRHSLKRGGAGANPFEFDDNIAYGAWREEKLSAYPRDIDALRVPVADLRRPSAVENDAIVNCCRRANMAIYVTDPCSESAAGHKSMRLALTDFGHAFGLKSMESHRSAEDDGIVAIEVTSAESKRGFIPYTTKALSWHTDGYYNPPDDPIRAMLLHCVRPAQEGGINALLDPDIVYIRMRDAGRALISAMLHPEAMTIPESVEEDGSVRPTSTGPVFLFDDNGRMTMRYTARKRNIIWRDDADTQAAVALLDRLLGQEEEPLILKYKMAAGEGLISNNVLHTRTAFENDDTAQRLLYRVRYRERLSGT